MRKFLVISLALVLLSSIANAQGFVVLKNSNTYADLTNKASLAAGGMIDTSSVLILDISELTPFAIEAPLVSTTTPGGAIDSDSLALLTRLHRLYVPIIGLFQIDSTAADTAGMRDYDRRIVVEVVPAVVSSHFDKSQTSYDTLYTFGSTESLSMPHNAQLLDTLMGYGHKHVLRREFWIPATRYAAVRIRTTAADTAGFGTTRASKSLRVNVLFEGYSVSK